MDDHQGGNIRFDRGPPLCAESPASLLLPSPETIMIAAVGRIVSAQTGDRMQVIRQEHGAANKRFERTPEIVLPFTGFGSDAAQAQR